MKKRLLATLLAVCLLIGMLPMAASAAAATGTGSVTVTDAVAGDTIVTPSNLHDTSDTLGDAELFSSNSYGITGSTEGSGANAYTAITVSATGLRKHQNAQQGMGYWAGIALTPPDGKEIARVKAAAAFSKDGVTTAFDNSATAPVTALDGAVNPTQDKDGFAMHLDVNGYPSQDLKNSGVWLKVQWYKADETTTVGDPMLFNVKYSGVTIYDVYGTAAWDSGRTGGSGCTVSVANVNDDPANVKATVTGNVEWYPASQSPTRQAGNMVGVTITPPASFDTSSSTFTWKSYTDASWNDNKDAGADTLTFYSTLTSETKTDTFTVKWQDGNEQTFTVDASGATLKGEWPTLTIPTGLPTGCTITNVKSKHADRNEMDVTNEDNYVQPGAVVTMTLTAGSGYHVKDAVTVNVADKTAVTATAGGNSTYTFTVPADATKDNDLTLVDPFEADQPTPAAKYAITKASVQNGSFTVKVGNSEVTEAAEDDEVVLTVTPESGYEIATVTYTPTGESAQNATKVSDGVYKFTMPAKAVEVNATFTQTVTPPDPATKYTVTVDGNIQNGTVTASKTSDLAENDEVTLTVTPGSGYEIGTVSYNDGTDHTINPDGNGAYKFTMPAANVTVTATFTQTTVTPGAYTVTVDGSIQNGTVTASKTANVAQGEEITLTVTPDSGYEIGTVSYNDGTDHTITPDGNGAYKFTMPAANVTVTATFTQIGTPVYGTVAQASYVSDGSETYTITGNGTAATNIAITGTLEWYPAGIAPTMEDGNAVAITITPPAGFDTSNSTVSLGGGTNITWDQFKTQGKDTATIAYVLDQSATSNTIEITWKAGSVQTFTLDYTGITGWASAWPTISGLGQKTEADVSASYTFSGREYGYLVTAPAKAGLTVTLDVDPNANYALDTLTVTGADGTDIPVDSTAHTFTMPDQNVTVNTTFTSTGGTTPVDPDPVVPTPVVPDPTPSDEPAVETITSSDGTVTTTTTWDDGKSAVAVKTPEGDTEITVTAPDGESVAKVEIPAEPTTVKEFEDVKTGSWYETAVNSTAGYGLFNGTSETTFSPDAGMTRGMLATVLHNLSGKPAYGTGEGAFTDVKNGTWYEDPIDWAYKTGVTSGTSANQFSPDQDITREQLVTMLYNYAKAIGAVSKNQTGLESFPDGSKVSGYAQNAMQWAVAEGFITGRANGSQNYIAPQGTATRAEVAVVLAKFVEYLK